MSVDRKKLILEAATKSFSLFGYKATTMDQVAKIANVGKGTIYTFYKNKEELFKEIVQRMIEEMKYEAEQSLDDQLSFFENLHRAVYRILEFRQEHQLSLKLLQEEREIGTPAVQEMVNEMEEAIVSYIKEKLKIAIDKGYIQPCDPEITAFLMLKMYLALIFDWERNHAPLEKEEIAELFKIYLFKGLSVT
ncbi:TetR/AcrR family transcriptional regulator [Peribacillus castrilensis]|uniref:TetR/AcrR family transcriptional regulator n=2 Tax=Peribacillus TaxID=2675229 RepID=A0AAJ1VAD8_9BACI|nr:MULTISPECIES: TetR/AcrR family transcriptional regulator [Bacillaceae]KOR77781.1 TetR family transcriptional regulator [Bacillus sp. FJAT-21352]KOR84066.1 TetR family transcriptional regulator [Bacillus sp. FJAT-22058]MBL3643479.1 TetR/AcrR family transcriptional regulator [Bacillus sp. RHFB]MCD1159798.1 TetR/AcrR family transcriptional regulator [Peribacillus castrilensis]MCP1096836.1 TetR/AcrR family transcriptional regulator [Bacillaceae bacterium OS4b]QYF81919.1 TetR/AcrR family transc